MKNIMVFMLIFFFSTSTFAQCNKPVNYITKGTPAYCTGYLVTPEQEYKFYQNNEENKLMQKLILKQDDHINLLDKRLGLYLKQNENLSERLSEEQNSQFWKYAVFFGAGAVLTGVLSYGLIRSVTNTSGVKLMPSYQIRF